MFGDSFLSWSNDAPRLILPAKNPISKAIEEANFGFSLTKAQNRPGSDLGRGLLTAIPK